MSISPTVWSACAEILHLIELAANRFETRLALRARCFAELGDLADRGRDQAAKLGGDSTRDAHEHRDAITDVRPRERRRERRRAHALFGRRVCGGELARVRFALFARLVELLLERLALDALRVRGQREDLHAAFENEATTITRRHAREPCALCFRRRGRVGTEDDGDEHHVAFAFDRDLRSSAASVLDEELQHAAKLRLVAEHLRAAARGPDFDRGARFRRDLPEERGEIGATAPTRHAHGAVVERREHLHRVVERIERRVETRGAHFGRRRIRFEDLHAGAKALGRTGGFLREEPSELLSRETSLRHRTEKVSWGDDFGSQSDVGARRGQ